jgi:hypothetical protein
VKGSPTPPNPPCSGIWRVPLSFSPLALQILCPAKFTTWPSRRWQKFTFVTLLFRERMYQNELALTKQSSQRVTALSRGERGWSHKDTQQLVKKFWKEGDVEFMYKTAGENVGRCAAAGHARRDSAAALRPLGAALGGAPGAVAGACRYWRRAGQEQTLSQTKKGSRDKRRGQGARWFSSWDQKKWVGASKCRQNTGSIRDATCHKTVQGNRQ